MTCADSEPICAPLTSHTYSTRPHISLRGEDFVDKDQTAYYLPRGVRSAMANDDAGMIGNNASPANEIGIVGDHYAALFMEEPELRIVIRSTETGFDRRGHVNAMTAQCSSDVGIHVLVEMKTNSLIHPSTP